jgi:hypothetical protein
VEAWIYMNLENSITETNNSCPVSTGGFEKKTDSREMVYGTNGATVYKETARSIYIIHTKKL